MFGILCIILGIIAVMWVLQLPNPKEISEVNMEKVKSTLSVFITRFLVLFVILFVVCFFIDQSKTGYYETHISILTIISGSANISFAFACLAAFKNEDKKNKFLENEIYRIKDLYDELESKLPSPTLKDSPTSNNNSTTSDNK